MRSLSCRFIRRTVFLSLLAVAMQARGQVKPGATPAAAKPAAATDAPKKAADAAPAADTTKPAAASKPTITDSESYKIGSGALAVAPIMQQLSIVGLGQVVAPDDHNLVFLIDRAALIKSLPKKPKVTGDQAVKDLEKNLEKIATDLKRKAEIQSVVVPLVKGAGLADFVASAKLIPGVISAAAVGDAYISISYDKSVSDAASFVKNLTQPLPPPDKHVQSATQRLYYMTSVEAGPAVATVINNMYPDVSAAFLAPDMIQLSMRDLPDDLRWSQTDTISDARRAIAKIDQPRPRASLDVWAIQIAGEHSEDLEQATPKIEEITSAYNETLARSLGAGWSYLTTHSKMDDVFSHYLQDVVVSGQDKCCAFGPSRSEAKKDGYALGYQTLLNPVTPNLVDMLVNIIAHDDPRTTATDVLDRMEGPEIKRLKGPVQDEKDCELSCKVKAVTLLKPTMEWCRQKDVKLYEAWIKETREKASCKDGGCTKKDVGIVVPPGLALSCVRSELENHLFAKVTEGTPNTSAIGQMRASIAEFLYQYKLMMRYPNDFHAYLEPMSADTLDVALLPIVDAFYDDLGVFQEAMQNQVYGVLKSKGVQYSSSGLLSIKMLAGSQGIVNSTSQNSFQMSQPASAADVSDAIASIKSDPTGAASKLIKLLSPTPVTATIGKQLSLTSTVHSLSGAYGMELDLLIDSAENGAPQVVQSGTTATKTDDLNSRVATHHLQTKVRVDNLKLFEVSTARSLVTRGQAPWVPLDPYFEIPILSQLVKKPRKPQAVYTQSLIFVNALVVPTAIDLAFGNPITSDVTAEATLASTKATDSNADTKMYREAPATELTGLTKDNSRFAINEYHVDMVRYLSQQYINGTGLIDGDASLKPKWRPNPPSSDVAASPANSEPNK